ncbi:MAG TPA: hypothetical protein PK228_03875 [Saprospiraceae bacterium]|nr:hypothetical protein [Saprospiraceae bacterium]
MNILEKIVESKKQEIKQLYEQYDLRELSDRVTQSHPVTSMAPRFYQALAETRAAGQPFFITEFKRKSPSEGWINRDADLPAQVLSYAQSGAGAISVLTDEPFFGGTYADLKLAAETLQRPPSTVHPLPSTLYPPPLLLQKDFILDPIQIYLAKLHGADMILLIAAILEPRQLDFLKKIAGSLGLGVLVEVHDAEELAKIRRLDFPVLGINNRDLKTFRTALNRMNVLTVDGGRWTVDGRRRFIIAESGIRDYLDFQVVRKADGFLIGTGLMRSSTLDGDRSEQVESKSRAAFSEHFQSHGRFLFKACGIRTQEIIASFSERVTSSPPLTIGKPDLIGINFSPASKRRIDAETLQIFKTCKVSGAVAVFYKNSETEIRETLEQYPFRAVQLYADDVTPEFIRSLKQRVLLAVRIGDSLGWSRTIARSIEPFAADVDFFILDGATPGSGQRIGAVIPSDFPYPFLLAGGLHTGNLEAILDYENCIGVDIASGIESNGQVDLEKIQSIATRLLTLREV